MEGHWKTTGSTLETQWLQKILSPVAFQFTLRSKFQAHWITTELPLAQGKGDINVCGLAGFDPQDRDA